MFINNPLSIRIVLSLSTLLSLFVCYAISVDIKYKNIMLNETNTVSIIGEIDEHSTPLILHSLITMVNNHQDVYIYLDTKGGSVHHGSKIVSEVLKHKVKCIAQNAFSMGFVIFQACKRKIYHTTIDTNAASNDIWFTR